MTDQPRARILVGHPPSNPKPEHWVAEANYRGWQRARTVHADVLGRINNGGTIWDYYVCVCTYGCPAEAIVHRGALADVAREWLADAPTIPLPSPRRNP